MPTGAGPPHGDSSSRSGHPAASVAPAGGATAAIGSGSGSGGSGTAAGRSSSAAALSGLPLRGCVSEYVQRWGWSPLPQGTEQLLRDILQTLRGMGVEYTLQEEHSAGAAPGTAAGAAQPMDATAATPRTAGSATGIGDSMTHRLILTIQF